MVSLRTVLCTAVACATALSIGDAQTCQSCEYQAAANQFRAAAQAYAAQGCAEHAQWARYQAQQLDCAVAQLAGRSCTVGPPPPEPRQACAPSNSRSGNSAVAPGGVATSPVNPSATTALAPLVNQLLSLVPKGPAETSAERTAKIAELSRKLSEALKALQNNDPTSTAAASLLTALANQKANLAGRNGASASTDDFMVNPPSGKPSSSGMPAGTPYIDILTFDGKGGSTLERLPQPILPELCFGAGCPEGPKPFPIDNPGVLPPLCFGDCPAPATSQPAPSPEPESPIVANDPPNASPQPEAGGVDPVAVLSPAPDGLIPNVGNPVSDVPHAAPNDGVKGVPGSADDMPEPAKSLTPDECLSSHTRKPVAGPVAVNGCTIPEVQELFTIGLTQVTVPVRVYFSGWREVFQDACNAHDVAYGTFSEWGHFDQDRAAADQRLLDQMNDACRTRFAEFPDLLEECHTKALAVYTGVRFKGGPFFIAAQKEAGACQAPPSPEIK